MNAYIYQAALLCESCATTAKWTLAPDADSDRYPQGPYANGGGEADCPQHCDHCNLFLENPLTTDGMEYVRESVKRWMAIPAEQRALGPATALTVWAPFYGITLD